MRGVFCFPQIALMGTDAVRGDWAPTDRALGAADGTDLSQAHLMGTPWVDWAMRIFGLSARLEPFNIMKRAPCVTTLL